MTAETGSERLALLVHEVRSPVAALAAIAETFGNDQLEHDGRRSLVELALGACDGIERVVRDASVTSLHLESVDLGPVVRATVESAVLRGAPVRAIVEDGLPPIRADAMRVRQALDNLVANAVTHGGSRDDVVVRAHVRDGELLLTVSDSGSGIPVEEQGRIFEPGVRLDSSRRGSGLGLAIVRRIADAHGAAVRLESGPDSGSTFTLAFPLP
jgi:signal transduction histidine kinase